jgi:hypothetical protein
LAKETCLKIVNDNKVQMKKQVIDDNEGLNDSKITKIGIN